MQRISETDLILNADGSVYHLNLLPGDIADTVITVGDPDRVGDVSKHFDNIELKKGKREFVTHTGTYQGKRITVISTGIGTDNIDIVFTELDALVNIDFKTRTVNPVLKSLDIIRIGTSGALRADIPVDSLLASSAAFGLEPLMHYYHFDQTENERTMQDTFKNALFKDSIMAPYYVSAGQDLLSRIANGVMRGITVTAPGFYAPQGRRVRARVTIPGLMEDIQGFECNGSAITNLEMETAGIYGMARALGHQAVSFNALVANRATQVLSKDPAGVMGRCIIDILKRIVA